MLTRKTRDALQIGETDVRIPADVRVRITALQTRLYRVTNIERNNGADRSLAGPTGGSLRPVLQLSAANLLLSSLSKINTKWKK